jgi:hypothetical protein
MKPAPTIEASHVPRRWLLWLAALTLAGVAAELAVERHWGQPMMLLAWLAIALAAVALTILARQPTGRRLRLARHLAIAAIAIGAIGIGAHVNGNFEAGPLDQRYATTWESVPLATRWWLAISKTVGPSPPFAPAAIAQAGLCLLLAARRTAGEPGS